MRPYISSRSFRTPTYCSPDFALEAPHSKHALFAIAASIGFFLQADGKDLFDSETDVRGSVVDSKQIPNRVNGLRSVLKGVSRNHKKATRMLLSILESLLDPFGDNRGTAEDWLAHKLFSQNDSVFKQGEEMLVSHIRKVNAIIKFRWRVAYLKKKEELLDVRVRKQENMGITCDSVTFKPTQAILERENTRIALSCVRGKMKAMDPYNSDIKEDNLQTLKIRNDEYLESELYEDDEYLESGLYEAWEINCVNDKMKKVTDFVNQLLPELKKKLQSGFEAGKISTDMLGQDPDDMQQKLKTKFGSDNPDNDNNLLIMQTHAECSLQAYLKELQAQVANGN